MAGVADEGARSVGRTARYRRRLEGELGVVSTGDREHGYGQVRERGSEEGLGAGARGAQRTGEPEGVTTASATLEVVVGQRRKEGLGEPLVEESFHPDLFDSPRELLIALAARPTLGRVLDAPARAEQHEFGDPLWMSYCHVQCDPCAVGIATQGDWFWGKAQREEIGGFFQCRAQGRGRAVTR